VESDPFASQVKVAQGDQDMIDMLAAHDHHFTFGENLGSEDCGAPAERFRWLPTRQPVVMDLWDSAPAPPQSAYTTITTWHNAAKTIAYRGDTYYWRKAREFEKFLDLPRRRGIPFELAAGVDNAARRRLDERGWRLVDSVEISKDVERYRRYIQRS